MAIESEKVFAGIHPNAQKGMEATFNSQEKSIVRVWAVEWYITRAGKRIINNSEYKFILAKPTFSVEESLGISREIVVIFSPYDKFEPRTLEAFDFLVKDFVEQRYEKVCYVLISGDVDIEKSLKECLTEQENQIVIPFSYNSFKVNKANNSFIRNQFRKFFYSRDLFDYSEPLKKNTFFFGRGDIVTQVIEKHKSGLNYGLFGLRKTGKTSILYDVMRKSEEQGFVAVMIDCQNTSFNMRRWNAALYYIINLTNDILNCNFDIKEQEFTLEDAANLFERYIQDIYKFTQKKILFLFDEIENITFGKSSVKHWCDELDFVYFWQSIRSVYQLTEDIFTFCIFGTNPKCVEEAMILGKDNPIYNMFQPFYIPGFTHFQTREMVRKLSRIMGMKFDEGVYTRLVEDYGGHPFLIRRVCSKIAQINSERPVTIDRIKYTEARRQFNLENNYFEMILEVLKQFYPDEYEMLKFLAMDDVENFNYFVVEDHSMIDHLVGYGLINEIDGKYDFRIDAIKEFLIRKSGFHPILVLPEEKWRHLCVERNTIEIDLRKMVKNIIKIIYKNETGAKAYVIKKVYANDAKYFNKSYQELFDSRESNIYLKKLIDLINADWEYFADYFGKQDVFISNINILNSQGRFDAHATIPEEDEINAVDNAIKYLKKCILKYQSSI